MQQGYTSEVVEALGVFSAAAVSVLRELMPGVSDQVLLLRLQQGGKFLASSFGICFSSSFAHALPVS